MKKVIIVIGMFLIVAGVLAWGADAVALRVKAEVANVRAQPDINAEVIARVNVGTILESLGKTGSWYKVEVVKNGKTLMGYVHASVVETADEDEEEEAEEVKKPVRRDPPRKESRTRTVRSAPEETYSSGIMLHGGLSLASMSHSDAETEGQDEGEYLKRKSGFLGGISFDMGRKVGLEIGIFYMQKGVTYAGTINDDDMNITGEAKVMIDEITAPVLLKVKFKPGSTPFIVAGGEVAYILSSKVNWSWDNPQTQQTESGSEDIKDYTNKLDYGLVFGAGYELNMSGMSLVIQGRYHLGLANIMKTEEAGAGSPNLVQDSSWARTNAIVLMLGIMF